MYIVNSYVFEIKNGKMRPGIDEYGCSGKGQKGFKRCSKSGPQGPGSVEVHQGVVRRSARGSEKGHQGVIGILSYDRIIHLLLIEQLVQKLCPVSKNDIINFLNFISI